MTNVSRKKVKGKVQKHLDQQLSWYLHSLHTRKGVDSFMTEFLTKAEKAMFAKRLGVIAMLEHGYAFEQIEKTLKVSPTTVGRIWRKKKEGLFTDLESHFERKRTKKQSETDFWDFLEALIQAGMPPRGKGRWKRALKTLD